MTRVRAIAARPPAEQLCTMAAAARVVAALAVLVVGAAARQLVSKDNSVYLVVDQSSDVLVLRTENPGAPDFGWWTVKKKKKKKRKKERKEEEEEKKKEKKKKKKEKAEKAHRILLWFSSVAHSSHVAFFRSAVSLFQLIEKVSTLESQLTTTMSNLALANTAITALQVRAPPPHSRLLRLFLLFSSMLAGRCGTSQDGHCFAAGITGQKYRTTRKKNKRVRTN